MQEDLKKPGGTDVTPSAVTARLTLACGLGNTGRLAECKEVFEPLLKLPGWVVLQLLIGAAQRDCELSHVVCSLVWAQGLV